MTFWLLNNNTEHGKHLSEAKALAKLVTTDQHHKYICAGISEQIEAKLCIFKKKCDHMRLFYFGKIPRQNVLESQCTEKHVGCQG